MNRALLGCVLLAVPAAAQEATGHRALAQALREGIIDSATWTRLNDILEDPVAHPADLPEELLEWIPGADLDCRERVKLLPQPFPENVPAADFLGARCAEALKGYWNSRRQSVNGSFAVKSSSLMDEVPAWNRELRGTQKGRGWRLRFGASPDRAVFWTRRQAALSFSHWALTAGDLDGWPEAPDLWSRPHRKGIPSLRNGSGSWLNGIDAIGMGRNVSLRAAAHVRESERAAALGGTFYGQSLSFAGGADSLPPWGGGAASFSCAAGDAALRLRLNAIRSGNSWNRSLRLEAKAAHWEIWGAWRRECFSSPMAALPGWAKLTGRDSLGSFRGGGLVVDGCEQWRCRGSLSAVEGGAGNLVLQSSAGLSRRWKRLRAGLSGQGSWFRRAAGETSWKASLRQEAGREDGRLRPSVVLRESSDSAGLDSEITSQFRWLPRRDWEAQFSLRQSLSERRRRELGAGTVLRPVPGMDAVCEVVRRQGRRETSDGRWYLHVGMEAKW